MLFRNVKDIFVIFILLGQVACGGGGSTEDQILDDSQTPTVQVVFPAMEGVNNVSVIELNDPPATPAGFSLSGKVYEVSVPESAPMPAQVSLPATAELQAMADTHQILIGRHNGVSWDLLPAALLDGNIVAEVDHFTPVAIFFRPLGDGGEGSLGEYIQTQPVVIPPPSLNWLVVQGDEVFAELDLTPTKYGTIPAPEGESESVIAIDAIQLFISTPLPDLGRPSPAEKNFTVMEINGSTVIQISGKSDSELSSYRIKLMPTEYFDYTGLLTQNVLQDINHKFLDRNSTPSDYGTWLMAVRPVLNDALVGKLSLRLSLPVGAADTHVRLRQGLANRLNRNQSETFLSRSAQNRYLLPYAKGWPESYNTPLRWDEQARLALFGVYYPLIGLKATSEWNRVVAHEWGHYATHMLMGDVWTKNAANGSHQGWKESESRELAWAEDLATFFGQWAVHQELTGLPEITGAMDGNMSQNSAFHYSQHPQPVEDIPLPENYWPHNQDMDAPSVEAVPATILSQLAQNYSFSAVMERILSTHPTSLIEFINEWFEYYGMNSSESLFLQNLCVDEGVTWVLHGHIVEAGETDDSPLQGVSVSVEGLNGSLPLLPEGYSDVNGDFKVTIPPGDVIIKFVLSDYESIDDLTLTASADFKTNEGFLDGEPKLFVNRGGVINREFESIGSAGAFRMKASEIDPINGGCPIIYDPNLDTDNYSGYLEINIMDKDNDGHFEDRFECSYWPSGKLMWDREVIDNKLNGYVLGYYETGEIQKLTPYTNGKIEGIQTRYYQSGEIKDSTPYTNNVENGIQKGFYESGNPEYLLPFTDSEIDGAYIYYYDSSGTIQAISHWVNGIQNGAFNTYWENELPQFEGYYVDDKKHGEQKFSLESGILSSCETWENGVQVGSCMP